MVSHTRPLLRAWTLAAAAALALSGCGDDTVNPSNPEAGPSKDATVDGEAGGDGAPAAEGGGADASEAGAEAATEAGADTSTHDAGDAASDATDAGAEGDADGGTDAVAD
jgi:hypothetical protein